MQQAEVEQSSSCSRRFRKKSKCECRSNSRSRWPCLRQDVERTRELLTREQDNRLKVVLPKRFQLREVRVLPLALTYLVPATAEDIRP